MSGSITAHSGLFWNNTTTPQQGVDINGAVVAATAAALATTASASAAAASATSASNSAASAASAVSSALFASPTLYSPTIAGQAVFNGAGGGSDPDGGVLRAIKIFGGGIAVLGGVKSDLVTTPTLQLVSTTGPTIAAGAVPPVVNTFDGVTGHAAGTPAAGSKFVNTAGAAGARLFDFFGGAWLARAVP